MGSWSLYLGSGMQGLGVELGWGFEIEIRAKGIATLGCQVYGLYSFGYVIFCCFPN